MSSLSAHRDMTRDWDVESRLGGLSDIVVYYELKVLDF